MKYINKNDIISVIQERLMKESVAMPEETTIEENSIIDDIEDKAIDLVISYISRRYQYTHIFTNPIIRNGVLVQIIASIVVYNSVRRNPARKVPEDYLQLYTGAIKQLEKIQSGAMDLVGCPLLTNDSGGPVSPVFGNNTKDDFFI